MQQRQSLCAGGSASADTVGQGEVGQEEVGQGEVGGVIHRVMCTWQLLGLSESR